MRETPDYSEATLGTVKGQIVDCINHPERSYDATALLSDIPEIDTLSLRQKVLLLDIIVLHANGGESYFLPAGRSIFDAIVRNVNGLRRKNWHLHTTPLLFARDSVIDFHSPQEQAPGCAYSDEGYRGVGFTYFFLDRAPKTARFSVDPGKGNHITYRIDGYNPTRYAVVCYLKHRYRTETEKWMRQLIAQQISGAQNNSILGIPSKSKFIVEADQLTQFISDTFRTCGAVELLTAVASSQSFLSMRTGATSKQNPDRRAISKSTKPVRICKSSFDESDDEIENNLTSGASFHK